MSTERRNASPRPARLALHIPDAGSSGVIDIADLHAEPLTPSLAAALAQPRPAAPTEPRAARAWPGRLLRSAVVIGVGIVGLGALLRLAPHTMTESARPADGNLSMHDAPASPTMMSSRPGSPRSRAPDPRLDERERAAAGEASPATIEPPTLADAPAEVGASAEVEPAPVATPSRSARARGRSDSRSAARERPTPAARDDGSDRSIPVECVLDPSRCRPAGASPAGRETTGSSVGERPSPHPEKLSAAQIKAALASTKADARRCGPDHGADAGTTVRVQLSIEGATGSVLSAVPQGEHAQGALGLCVARALGQAEFPRFTAKRMGTLYSVRL